MQQQQHSTREMEASGGGAAGAGGGGGMNSMISHSHSHSQMSMEDLHHHNGHYHHHHHHESQNSQHHDDFLDQILSTIPNCSWPPNPSSPSNNPNPTSSNPNPNPPAKSADSPSNNFMFEDASSSLASKLRLHHTHVNKSLLLQHHQQQQQLLLSRRSPSASAPDSAALLPFPLSLAATAADSVDSHLLADRSQSDVVDPSPFKSPSSQPQGAGDGSVHALYNAFGGSLQSPNQQQQHFHHPPPQGGAMPGQNFGSQPAALSQGQVPPASVSTGGSSGAAPQRQRVRARRGQATDPHSIAERLRRERIAERMKALQELVPNANKTDKASMLDEIIDYVKFLQLQVKVLSMSRLGGAAAVAPHVADMPSEGGGGGVGGGGRSSQTNDTMSVTEHQVAKLMEEDMGSAMQYLQGKGLCLMPISLATAISTATCHSRPPTRPLLNDITTNLHPLTLPPPPSNAPPAEPAPTSPNMSALTVQSATLANASLDPSSSLKDTKP